MRALIIFLMRSQKKFLLEVPLYCVLLYFVLQLFFQQFDMKHNTNVVFVIALLMPNLMLLGLFQSIFQKHEQSGFLENYVAHSDGFQFAAIRYALALQVSFCCSIILPYALTFSVLLGENANEYICYFLMLVLVGSAACILATNALETKSHIVLIPFNIPIFIIFVDALNQIQTNDFDVAHKILIAIGVVLLNQAITLFLFPRVLMQRF